MILIKIAFPRELNRAASGNFSKLLALNQDIIRAGDCLDLVINSIHQEFKLYTWKKWTPEKMGAISNMCIVVYMSCYC